MLYSEIIQIINKLAPEANAAKWDNSGLQFMCNSVINNTNIKHIAFCLDINAQNIQKAVESKADMLISHHPLNLEAEYLNKNNKYYHTCKELFNANIPVYSIHTPLDLSSFASWLSEDLNMQSCQILAKEDNKDIGFGQIGELKAIQDFIDFEKKLKNIFNQQTLRYAGAIPKEVKTIAFCGGSGASFIDIAKEKGADVYISGDFKYHNTEDLGKLLLIDIGHFAFEEEMLKRFCGYLKKQLEQIRISYIEASEPFFIR